MLINSAVLFDMDGVVLDSEPLYTQAEIRLFGEYGIHIPDGYDASHLEERIQNLALNVIELRTELDNLEIQDVENFDDWYFYIDIINPNTDQFHNYVNPIRADWNHGIYQITYWLLPWFYGIIS